MKPKSKEEIEILAEGGHKLAEILKELVKKCDVGVTAKELDDHAENRIKAAGGTPSFKGFGSAGQEFPNAICVSPNSMVVHGIPYKELEFKNGDLIGVDIGMKYKGLFTDHAVTVAVGDASEEDQKLLDVTRQCLDIGIKESRVGNKLGDIGYAVQAYAEKQGYGVVRRLTGHAVGYDVHEEPRIPNYGKSGTGEELVEGAVLAIEPMIVLGGHDIKTSDDGWGVETADGTMSAHFEHTIAVTKDGPRILTI